MNKLAVIDLGTNTFHLLIVEAKNGSFHTLERERQFIKLAAEGIEKIGEAPYKRALNTLDKFAQRLAYHQITQVQAFGTAALRTASNGPNLIQEVKERTGIQIQLIDGNREAKLIHKGIKLAVPFEEEDFLLMDIGGGSVEFIIANNTRISWSQSFPIGVAVLFKNFHHADPITDKEIQDLVSFLQTSLSPLNEALKDTPSTKLVGASGTFDVLENMLGEKRDQPHFAKIKNEQLDLATQKIITSSFEERKRIPEIPSQRTELIVVALVLINVVRKMANIQEIIVSDYAMKEGMLAEMMETL